VLEMIIVVMMMVMWQHPCPFYQSFHTSSSVTVGPNGSNCIGSVVDVVLVQKWAEGR
jgi:hypothetical protein